MCEKLKELIPRRRVEVPGDVFISALKLDD
jgi:hypothetical protein